MKGIILAGGTGSRLWPMTRTVSKQLLPIYDKPMIYYPISTLMLAGIREILIITTPQDQSQFRDLLGDGSSIGVSFKYAKQTEPKGLAQALTIGEEFLAGSACLMILGDNIFHGAGLGRDINRVLPTNGAHIFTYNVQNPSEYGVLQVDEFNRALNLYEKPSLFVSNLAITGLYYFDKLAPEYAHEIKPSKRGELEITELLSIYLNKSTLSHTPLSRGSVWLDTGKPNSLHDASTYVRVIEERTGQKIACLEEVAFLNGWIDEKEVLQIAKSMKNSEYSAYLERIPNFGK